MSAHIVTAEQLYNEVEMPQCTECGVDIINGECECLYQYADTDDREYPTASDFIGELSAAQYEELMRIQFGHDMEQNLIEYGVIDPEDRYLPIPDCDAFYGSTYGDGGDQCPECGARYNCVDGCMGGM